MVAIASELNMVNTTDHNLEELFQVSSLSEEEKAVLFADIGNLILESATMRFMMESDEDTMMHFSRLVEAYADKDDLHIILSQTFPAFGVIVEEEAEAFREDAKRLLSNNGSES